MGRAKYNLKARLVAGCWFAVTGFIPAFISFLATSWSNFPIGSRVFLGFVIIPIPIFALCGSVIGAPILYESRGRGDYAGLRGATVAALSLTLCVLVFAVIATLGSRTPDLGGLVVVTFYFMFFWAAIRFLPIIIIGAFAGWLLYRCRFTYLIAP